MLKIIQEPPMENYFIPTEDSNIQDLQSKLDLVGMLRRFRFYLLVPAILAGCASRSFVVVDKGKFNASELFERKDVQSIVVKRDPAFGNKSMSYSAIRAERLFKKFHFPKDSQLKFNSHDGYSVTIPTAKVMNISPEKAVAYIAIENPREPWPMTVTKKSAGPFYLVWLNPELSRISRDQWPYQIKSIEVLDSR